MDALRSVLNNREPSQDEERGILDGIADVTTLSWSTRLKCFLGCFLVGVLFSILGSVVLFFGLAKGLTAFSVLYTLGNLTSIASTMFLVGPVKQLKNIFAHKRIVASIVMITCLVLTLVAAFVVKSAVLALTMIVIQFFAMAWYSISYIPYARDMVINCLKGLF